MTTPFRLLRRLRERQRRHLRVALLGDFGQAALRRGGLGRPMHYRTRRVNFLETADAFLEQIGAVERPDGPVFETAQVSSDARAIVPAAP